MALGALRASSSVGNSLNACERQARAQLLLHAREPMAPGARCACAGVRSTYLQNSDALARRTHAPRSTLTRPIFSNDRGLRPIGARGRRRRRVRGAANPPSRSPRPGPPLWAAPRRPLRALPGMLSPRTCAAAAAAAPAGLRGATRAAPARARPAPALAPIVAGRLPGPTAWSRPRACAPQGCRGQENSISPLSTFMSRAQVRFPVHFLVVVVHGLSGAARPLSLRAAACLLPACRAAAPVSM